MNAPHLLRARESRKSVCPGAIYVTHRHPREDAPPAPPRPTRWQLVLEHNIRIGRQIRVEAADRSDNRARVYFITLSGGLEPRA